MKKTARTMGLISAVVFALSSCSIQDYTIDLVSDALTGDQGSSVFLEENDPELVGDALPFAIKLYESLLVQNPGHPGLTLSIGSLYIMYANAFLQTPSLYLPPEDYDERVRMLARAKNLYLRGRDQMLDFLEDRYPGLENAIDSGEGLDRLLADFTTEDVPYAYWLAAGWFGAVSIDSFDMQLAFRIPALMEILDRAYGLDPDFNNAALDELYIQVYASIPEAMGGSRDLAEQSFSRAVTKQEGSSASPYVSLATSVAIPTQDLERFVSLLEQALAIDPDTNPDLRLLNTISQRRARWYLDNLEDYFIF